MERELWPGLYPLVTEVGATISPKYVHHPPWLPALVLPRAAVHGRPIRWACDPRDGAGTRPRPPRLPSPSAMTRRPRSRAAGRMGRGYKPHATRAGRAVPEAWDITPRKAAGSVVAAERVGRAGGGGYRVGDGNDDRGPRLDAAAEAVYQRVVPADDPAAGRGHRRVSRHRRRGPELARSSSARGRRRHRRRIESGFGARVSFAGGRGGLPAGVRRAWRVRSWVWAKLLIDGARIRRRQRLAAQME